MLLVNGTTTHARFRLAESLLTITAGRVLQISLPTAGSNATTKPHRASSAISPARASHHSIASSSRFWSAAMARYPSSRVESITCGLSKSSMNYSCAACLLSGKASYTASSSVIVIFLRITLSIKRITYCSILLLGFEGYATSMMLWCRLSKHTHVLSATVMLWF